MQINNQAVMKYIERANVAGADMRIPWRFGLERWQSQQDSTLTLQNSRGGVNCSSGASIHPNNKRSHGMSCRGLEGSPKTKRTWPANSMGTHFASKNDNMQPFKMGQFNSFPTNGLLSFLLFSLHSELQVSSSPPFP